MHSSVQQYTAGRGGRKSHGMSMLERLHQKDKPQPLSRPQSGGVDRTFERRRKTPPNSSLEQGAPGPSSAADDAKDPYEYGGSDEDFQDDVGRAAKKPRAASVPPSSPTPLPPTRSIFARPPVRKPAWVQVANSSKMFGSGSQQPQVNNSGRLRLPVGMVNRGNTCYANSGLQVLLSLRTLMQDLAAVQQAGLALPEQGLCKALLQCAQQQREALQHSASGSSSRPPAINPDKIRCAMGRVNRKWQGGEQEDVHEFFCALLELLQWEVLAGERAATGNTVAPVWATLDPVTRNFSGTLLKSFTCRSCGHVSSVTDSFTHLSLDLPPASTTSLQDTSLAQLLALHFKDEVVHKACEGCKQREAEHTQHSAIRRLPRVLLLHLKRFHIEPTPSGGIQCRKVRTHIVPNVCLSLAPECVQGQPLSPFIQDTARGRLMPRLPQTQQQEQQHEQQHEQNGQQGAAAEATDAADASPAPSHPTELPRLHSPAAAAAVPAGQSSTAAAIAAQRQQRKQHQARAAQPQPRQWQQQAAAAAAGQQQAEPQACDSDKENGTAQQQQPAPAKPPAICSSSPVGKLRGGGDCSGLRARDQDGSRLKQAAASQMAWAATGAAAAAAAGGGALDASPAADSTRPLGPADFFGTGQKGATPGWGSTGRGDSHPALTPPASPPRPRALQSLQQQEAAAPSAPSRPSTPLIHADASDGTTSTALHLPPVINLTGDEDDEEAQLQRALRESELEYLRKHMGAGAGEVDALVTGGTSPGPLPADEEEAQLQRALQASLADTSTLAGGHSSGAGCEDPELATALQMSLMEGPAAGGAGDQDVVQWGSEEQGEEQAGGAAAGSGEAAAAKVQLLQLLEAEPWQQYASKQEQQQEQQQQQEDAAAAHGQGSGPTAARTAGAGAGAGSSGQAGAPRQAPGSATQQQSLLALSELAPPATSLLQEDFASYDLQAVVRHVGLLADYGHFVADILQAGSNVWHTYNDTEVSRTSWSQVLANSVGEGYLLLYSNSKAAAG